MRHLSVAWLLPLLLLFGQSAEAARISFVTKDCGTPPLLGLEFGIDATGTSIVLDTADECPTEGPNVIAGDLVGDDDSPFYGPLISSLDLTIISSQELELSDFDGPGDFFGTSSLGFSFTFAPTTAGGGVLSIMFAQDIELSCDPVGDGFSCLNLDLLIHIGPGRSPLEEGSIIRVTRVNDLTAPEPATLGLFGIAVAAAAVRRPAIAKKSRMSTRGTSAPDTAHRT